MTVANAGDTSGALTPSQADRVDSPTTAGPLSAVLDLAVIDVTAGRTVFAGKLAALQSVALGDFAQGDSHRYRFVVTFPGGGAPALDNQFQVASTTVSYFWSAGPVAPARQPTAAPPASTPVSTLGSTVSRPAPAARLIATARQRGRGGNVQVQLVCQAACRALPRRARAAVSAGRRTTFRIKVRVSIDGRNLVLRKTVRLISKRR